MAEKGKEKIPVPMRVKRKAHMHARAERRLKRLAWQLGVTPRLLKATLGRTGDRSGMSRAA